MAGHFGYRRKTVGTGVSVIAMAALWSGAAMGQCAPNPSVSGQTVSCSGTTSDTYVITTSNSPLTVASDATVATSTGQGIVVSIPATTLYSSRTAAITLDGSVTASNGSGIQVLSGPPIPGTYDFYGTSATITVAQGASVSGITGISVSQTASPYSVYAGTTVSIDNAGTITGTGGVAISGDDTSYVNLTVTNEATGTIGAINAPLLGLINAGTIDGGSLSAVTTPGGAYYASITNSGTITSANAAATIDIVQNGNVSLLNSGTIANTGGGAALVGAASVVNDAGATISANGSTVITGANLVVTNSGTITNTGSGTALSGTNLSLVNDIGGVISGASGAPAIAVAGTLSLANQGTINGDVYAGGIATVDSSLGTINGNVTFGTSGATVVATLDNGAVQTGITGTITAPAGTNTLQIDITSDATLSNVLTLPANFDQLALSPGSGATLTLASGFSSSGTIDFIGYGSLANTTSLSGSGTVIEAGYYAGQINNSGTITSTNAAGAATIEADGYTTSVTNSGTIAATGSGAAISGFYTVTNQAGGTISGTGDAVITGPSLYLTNSGTIANTGSGSALSITYASVQNQAGGTISASGATVITSTQMSVENSGTITNTGSGTALSGTNLTLNNEAGGVVSGGMGAPAIAVGGALSLINQGTIDGDVYAGGGGTVDSTQGTVNGNLIFGASGDTVVATLVNGAVQTGVTGTITAPVGTNTLQLDTTTDATLSGGLSLPTNFNQLALSPASGTTLTLGSGFTASGTIDFVGGGTLVNATTLSGSGTIIDGAFLAGNLVNTGTVASSNASGSAAIILTGSSTLTNSGTITATGAGVLMDGNGVTNSGTITAAGIAVDIVNASIGLANSGTITSLGGTAVVLGQSCTCLTSTNSGTINGAQLGVLLEDGVLVNSGTITSGAIGVSLSYYGTLVNSAGGTISAVQAIANPYGAATIVNAGQIDGNVTLAAGSVYDAVTGGALNGNLTLGSGGTLIVDYSATGGFAGINGSVSATQSNLVYNVGSDTSVTLGGTLPDGFATVGYQLSNDAALALGTTGTLGTTVSLSGTGSVTFNGSVATTGSPALISSAVLAPQGGSVASTALTITNMGSLSATNTSPYTYFYGAVVLGSSDTLVNSGTIAMTDTSGGSDVSAAVFGGQSIVNSGQITGTGAYGIALGDLYLPSSQVFSLTNSGTISSTIDAIYLGNQTAIVNTGTISSSGGAAIASSYYDFISTSVTNAAGGIISGNGNAIVLAGGTVNNAGTINGNVVLGTSPQGYPSYDTGIYIANGGALNGNLTFGDNTTSMLIETGSGFGVTGTISVGSTPEDSYIGHLRTANATVALGGALPIGFGQEFVLASGASTTVTVTGPADNTGAVLVGGDGSIVNQANTTGALETLDVVGLAIPGYTDTPLASLTNQATVGGVAVSAVSLINSGTVTGYAGQNFTGSAQVTNSGTIGGGLFGEYVYPSSLPATGATYAITNSGTITGGTGSPAIQVYTAPYYYNYGVPTGLTLGVSLTNSGTITGDIVLPNTGTTIVDSAAGTITGDILLVSDDALSPAATNSVTIAGAYAGSIDGGSGASTSLAVSGGSATAPVAFANLGNIASYSQTGGYATLSGNAVLGGVTITGGDLVGLVGSTITTGTLSIGAQGTFQSGGTVNGNIVNAGMLHVGASPDTLKVNGNVALNAGSTTLFEVSPSASSKLVVSGKVTIASGSTLQIKTLQAIMPGTSLDLIAAAGGISGTFSQVDGLYGKLIMVDGDLTMLALFDPAYAPNAQVAGSIGYVNSALASGNASSALMAALPVLTASDGAPLANAFARLTPEAYASAIQIGVENGLILSRAARDITADRTMVSGHLFSFGQALGNWRGMHGDSEGASAANISGFGFLGGLGVQAGPVSLAAFGGYLDQTQSISALGASTRATGFVGGVTAALETGPVGVTVSALRDQSDATTTRSLPGSGLASADYALHGWTADAQIGVRLPLGSGWQAKPHVGWTWVWTERGAVNETGNSVFDLDVDAMHHTAGFVDGGLRIANDPSQRRLTSFVDLGVRWQVQGRLPIALGSFDGLPADFAAQGVRRSPVSALVSSGVSYRLTPAVNVLLSASGELTATGASTNVTGGVRVHF